MRRKQVKLIAFFLLSAMVILGCVMAAPSDISFTIPGIGLTISRNINQEDSSNSTKDNNEEDSTIIPDEDQHTDKDKANEDNGNEGDSEVNDKVTRGEFAEKLYNSFIYLSMEEVSLTDVDDSEHSEAIYALVGADIMFAYDDNTFRPDNLISRGEAIKSIIKAAKLDTLPVDTGKVPFIDINDAQEYSPHIEIAHHLTLLPWGSEITFSPNNSVTVGEVNELLDSVKTLHAIDGEIESTNMDTGTLSVLNNNGEETELQVTNNTHIFKNMHSGNVASLQPGDKVIIIAKNDMTAKHITAASTLPEAVVGELGSLIEYFLSPEQLKDLVSGDYANARTTVESEIYDQLNAYGLTEDEIKMLLDQNWDELRDVGTDRVIGTIGNQLQLPNDVVRTIIQQDWDQLLGFAQLQLAQETINHLIESR